MQSSSSSTSTTYKSPCAACKFLRRKCLPGCIFAPHFPPEDPQKFSNVHKIFGASNVSKILNEVPPHRRDDAVSSLAYEADARVRDPVYGCVGAVSFLQGQIDRLQKELDATNADLARYSRDYGIDIPSSLVVPSSSGFGGEGGFSLNSAYALPYHVGPLPNRNLNSPGDSNTRGGS